MGRNLPSLKQRFRCVQSWLQRTSEKQFRGSSLSYDSSCTSDGGIRNILKHLGIHKFPYNNARSRWSDLTDELDRLHGELEEVSRLAEPDFALLAANLGKLHQSTSGLSRAVEESLVTVLTRLEGIRLGGDDGAASQTLADLRVDIQHVCEQVSALDGTIQRIGELRQQSEAIYRIGSFLTACGLNFAVESARRSETANEFAAYCQDLRSLATTVTQAGTEFGDECERTHSAQIGAIKNLRTQLGEIEQLIAPAQQAVSATTQEMQTLVSLTRRTLDSAIADSTQITRRAHEVLFHLQLGDIVRQKCEHVSHALEVAQQHARELDSVPTDQQPQIVAGIHQMLAIQAGQLKRMREEIISAHRELSEAFKGVSVITERIAAHTISLTELQVDGETSTNLFEKLKEALKGLEVIQRRGERLRDGAKELHAHAGRSTARLGEQLQSVKRINAEIHLQSLNAIIRTCHLGEQGHTLGVLAMHMHDAFQDSNTCVQQVISTLNDVLERKHLENQNCAVPAGGDPASGRSSHCFFTATTEISELYRQLHGAATSAGDAARQQEAVVADVQARLEFLPELSDELVRREQAIRALMAALEPLLGTATGDSTVLASLAQQYTMESEREIHRQIAGVKYGEPAVPMPAETDTEIEFFDFTLPGDGSEMPKATNEDDDKKRTKATQMTPAPQALPDLGDNVELF